MNVKEFVENMVKNTKRQMREDDISSIVVKALDIKQYLGIKQKKALIDRIIDDSILYENGVFKFDNIRKYICFTMYTLEAYTNLELSEDIEDDFDVISESKLLPIVVCIIQKEYDDVNLLLEMQCDYVLAENDIEAQVGKFLDNIINKIDDAEVVIKKYLSHVDWASMLKDKEKLFSLIEKMIK